MPPGSKLSLLLSFQNLLKIRFFIDVSEQSRLRQVRRDRLCWSLVQGSFDQDPSRKYFTLIFSWVFWLLLSSSLEAWDPIPCPSRQLEAASSFSEFIFSFYQYLQFFDWAKLFEWLKGRLTVFWRESNFFIPPATKRTFFSFYIN